MQYPPFLRGDIYYISLLILLPDSEHTLLVVLSGVGEALLICLFVVAQSNFSVGLGGNTELVQATDRIGCITKTKSHTQFKHINGGGILSVIIQLHCGGVKRTDHMALLVLVNAIKLLVSRLRAHFSCDRE